MTDANSQIKGYCWLRSQKFWVIARVDDPGVVAVMSQNGAEIYETAKKKYWRISDGEVFRRLEPILINAGYAQIETKQNTEAKTSYQAPQKVQSPLPVKTLTISELNRRIQNVIETNICEKIWIRGEISGYKGPNQKSGHHYFELIESQTIGTDKADILGKINAIVWKQSWVQLHEKIVKGMIPPLENGTEIRVLGKINYTGKFGQINFVIEDIDEHFAEGEFYKKKEEIYRKLIEMNIHESNIRLPMPLLPYRIALFSNKSAEGYNDFIKTLNESGYPYRVTLFSVALQGRYVEQSFMEAFRHLAIIGIQNFDIAIMIRGGGSISDLSSFNNFKIAEWIARSSLKFIVGIGHERDRSIIDEIALRVKTPTAAGMMLNDILDKQCRWMHDINNEIVKIAQSYMMNKNNELRSLMLLCSNTILHARMTAIQDLDNLKHGLCSVSKKRLQSNFYEIKQMVSNLSGAAHYNIRHLQGEVQKHAADLRSLSQYIILSERQKLGPYAERVIERTKYAFKISSDKLKQYQMSIDMYDPKRFFKLGYVAMTDESGCTLNSVFGMQAGQKILIRMTDGRIKATVNDVEYRQQCSEPEYKEE